MIQEDHGKAILIFTIVSITFLPLSFVTSYLGMNTADIRDMSLKQNIFWEIAIPFTAVVVTLVLMVSYNAGRILQLLRSLLGA
jgi:Mg2+ and Co2+ transporter CorA